MAVFVFGHRNPDTDSVTSCIALSSLKNQSGIEAVPGVLGNINKESRFVLDYFAVPVPELINNVKIQVRDINIDRISGIRPESSILSAYKLMEKNNHKTLAVTDDNGSLLGIITMKDIAMAFIKGDFYRLSTSIGNILNDLGGELLSGHTGHVEGKIVVVAYHYDTVKGTLTRNNIVIVGDRYDVVEYAIETQVRLIIITGSRRLPAKTLQLAQESGIPVISVSTDTYSTAKLINHCSYISTIMKAERIVTFNEDTYLDEVREEIISTSYRNYPVVNDENIFLGFLNRRHALNPGRKKVILVDHNEYTQSADGLDEAEILEIVDHHKIGDISTPIPISFKNVPVGSTCTIVFYMYRDMHVKISYEIAGVLISGIISDTLMLKSPTTTDLDREAVEELSSILNIDTAEYSASMFKAGTSLEGHSMEEIFYKDFKEFSESGKKMGISQVFTLDIEDIFNRKKQLLNIISKVHRDKGYFLTLTLITDILKEGSYLFFKCSNKNLVPMAFNIEARQGAFVPDTVSRKKQVIPRLLEAINMLR